MLKALPFFIFFLFVLSSSLSFAGEQKPLPRGTLTVQQYAEFLCATAATDCYNLYNEKMGDDPLLLCIVREGEPGSYSYQAIPERADDPVPYVSRLSAKRYCNWLQNGQPIGAQNETTTERGAYILDGIMDQDPKKEESATYFLPGSTNSEIDPSLASNLTTYIIITHLADSFKFSNTSSQDETTAWTVGGVIAGVAGIAAVLRCRGGMHREERSENDYVDSTQTTAQARREEETCEINAQQRGDNDSSSLDEGDRLAAARIAPSPQPWADATVMSIKDDYLKWIVGNYNSKQSLIEQVRSLRQDQRKKIDEQNPEVDSVLSKINEHALQINCYWHLMSARLSSPSSNINFRHNNSHIEAWLQKFQPLLYNQYLNFYTSRTPKEFQTTCFSRWFLEPEHCREQAYQDFIKQLTTDHEIGLSYWPYERILKEWKNQAATASWALPLEQEADLRAALKKIPAWKRPTQTQVQRSSDLIFFNRTVDVNGGVLEKRELSDQLSKLSPPKSASKRDPHWGSGIKKILRDLSSQWLEKDPDNSFFITLHNKLHSPQTRISWNSQEKWHQWYQQFKASTPGIKEAIKKKTALLDDWESWRENSYGPHPRRLEVWKKEAADIWKAQIEATLDELNELLKTAKEIQEQKYEITSAIPIKTEFKILFQTTFSHLHRISNHIEDASPVILKPLSEQEFEIQTFLINWHNCLEQNLHGLDFVPFYFQMQIEKVIKATKTLADLVDQHQDQALRLRQIAEEEKTQQQCATAVRIKRTLPAPPESQRNILDYTDNDTTDNETTPIHNRTGTKPLGSPSKTPTVHFLFPGFTGDSHNGARAF